MAECGGTPARERYVFENVEGKQQSVPADAGIEGCGHEVKIVRRTRGFRKAIECVICPRCDGPSK